MSSKKISGRLKRKYKVKLRIKSIGKPLRLSVFRSNRYIYAQIIDDRRGKTLVYVSEKQLSKDKLGLKKTEKAIEIGKMLAEQALKQKISQVVFDRNGFQYHGRVKAVAEGAKSGGLKI